MHGYNFFFEKNYLCTDIIEYTTIFNENNNYILKFCVTILNHLLALSY
jgi:hypothetical protein